MYKQDELEWIGVRFLDANVRTFRMRDTFYKAVLPARRDYVGRLFEQGTIPRLEEMECIPRTRRTDLAVEGFAAVYEQYTEYFNITPEQWNPLLHKDAALLFLRLNKELAREGLGTVDGHPGNIVVQKNGRPFWCDIGSFVPLGDNPLVGIDEFIRHFVYPLLLRAKGPELGKLSRYLLKAGCTEEEARFLLGGGIPRRPDRAAMLDMLEELVSGVEIGFASTTWTGYHGELQWEGTDPEDAKVETGSPARTAMLKRIIRLLRPERVVDFGANGGFYSQVAAHTGAEVLAVELDEGACAECHVNFNRSPADARMKVALSGIYVPDRLPDLALALALSHHMFFTHNYRFEVMAKTFADSTSRHLITEFMPNGLGVGRNIPDPLPPHYRVEVFARELERHFAQVEVAPYPGYAHRMLLICRDKKS